AHGNPRQWAGQCGHMAQCGTLPGEAKIMIKQPAPCRPALIAGLNQGHCTRLLCGIGTRTTATQYKS
ncbi:MAG: hypothetical protein QF705_07060, partial [Arenicellales bacterium]|nr:hypothetical protein [Arenicellales bacterium]